MYSIEYNDREPVNYYNFSDIIRYTRANTPIHYINSKYDSHTCNIVFTHNLTGEQKTIEIDFDKFKGISRMFSYKHDEIAPDSLISFTARVCIDFKLFIIQPGEGKEICLIRLEQECEGNMQ